jgi:hypothetical protein
MLPRVRFRLARGPVAPSREVPPRSRVGHPLRRTSASLEALMGSLPPVPAPPTGAFNVLTPASTQVKHESTHAVPLTHLGIISRRGSANPPGEAIPTTVQHCAVRPGSAP